MVPPAYRDIAPDDIPVVMSDKATVRILSGSHRGIRGTLDNSYVQITYLDVTLPADASWSTTKHAMMKTYFSICWKARFFPEVRQQSAESNGLCHIIFCSRSWRRYGRTGRGESRTGRRTFPFVVGSSPERTYCLGRSHSDE